MAGESFSQSSGYSTTTPVQSPQSAWGLQLSQMLSALGQNQYNWAMNQFNNGMGVTNQNIDQYRQLAGQGAGLAQQLLTQYENTFEPMMDKYAQQAGSYNSEDRQRFNMGQAESTVAQADQAARDSAERQLQSYGVNPNSGRYQDLMLTSRIQDAAARAGAGTQASVNTAAAGRQMTADVAHMGQNVPGMAVNALQSAYTGVTGAQNAELGMLNTGANLTSSAAPFFNAASGAIKMPTNATQSKQQSTGGSFQTQPPPPTSNSGNSGGPNGRSAGAPVDASGSGKGWMPDHTPGNPAGVTYPANGLKPPPGRGNAPNDPSWQDPNLWYNKQDEQGNPLYDPAAWDYLNSQNSANGVLEPGTIGNWNQGQNPNSDFNSLDPNFGMGSGPSTQGPDTQDWSNPMTFSGQTDQNLPADPSSWNANKTNPNQEGVDPWANAQNPLQQDFTGSLGQTQDNYNYGEDQQYQMPQDDSGGGGWQNNDYSQGTADNSGGNDEEWLRNQGGGGGYAAGGPVRRGVLPTSGGPVPNSASPSQGQQTDDVPARLNAGEFVIPRDVTQHLGTKHFHKLIEQSRRARTGMAGPPARPQMKPALGGRPTFTSRSMGA